MRKDIALMKRQRVMDYFINATIDIVSESGIDSVTLRSVAEKAGYNSATLYNYFENIDQFRKLVQAGRSQDIPQLCLSFFIW